MKEFIFAAYVLILIRSFGPGWVASGLYIMSNGVVEVLHHYGSRFRNFLNRPLKVLLVCNCVFAAYLFMNGAVWRVWGLKRDQTTISKQIQQAQQRSLALDMQIKQAKDQSYIARQAKDKLDMVGEQDLVFVFPE